MSYIGVQAQNHVSPAFHREVVTPDGSASYFDLVQDVPGFNADNVLVVVNNVVQHPYDSYTIKADANGNPRRLDFAGSVPASTDVIYVTHRGVGSLNMTPAAGSVDSVALADNLRSGVVNSFTGSQATNSSTELTLTEEPLNAQSIMVYVNGVYQKPTTNYTVSGTTLTFTGALASSDEIDVHHLSIRTGVVHVADRSVTSDKLDDNITIRGNLTVSGTTTTIDTTVTTSDAMVINNAGTDVGLKINSTSTGHIIQLQDGGTDVMVVADGGNVGIGTTSPNNKLHVRGADTTSSLVVGNTTENTQFEVIPHQDDKIILRSNDNGSARNLTFETGTTERMRIASGGDVTVSTGNLVIGTAGQGINFSAYATSGNPSSNLLDDYEEGTWTATATGTSAIANTTGYYQKIGDRCFFYWYSDGLTMTSAVNAIIGGLPFTCASGSTNYSAITAQHNNYAPNSTGGYVVTGNTTIDLLVTNQVYRDTTASSGTKYIMISGSYKVA